MQIYLLDLSKSILYSNKKKMPKRKSYAGRKSRVVLYKRKQWRKKARVKRPIPLGFPQSYISKLKYVDRITINPGIGSFAEHIFRANSCFDPDYTGVGHQPKTFDQFMALYQHYTVIGARIKVKPLRTTGDTNDTVLSLWGCTLMARFNDVATMYADNGLSSILESRMIGSRKTRHTGLVYNLNKSSDALTCSYSAKKFFKAKAIIDESQHKGTDSTNPTEDVFFSVWAVPPDGSSDAAAQTYLVEIEYITVFTEPIPINSS